LQLTKPKKIWPLTYLHNACEQLPEENPQVSFQFPEQEVNCQLQNSQQYYFLAEGMECVPVPSTMQKNNRKYESFTICDGPVALSVSPEQAQHGAETPLDHLTLMVRRGAAAKH
jgi:hypothetical protein